MRVASGVGVYVCALGVLLMTSRTHASDIEDEKEKSGTRGRRFSLKPTDAVVRKEDGAYFSSRLMQELADEDANYWSRMFGSSVSLAPSDPPSTSPTASPTVSLAPSISLLPSAMPTVSPHPKFPSATPTDPPTAPPSNEPTADQPSASPTVDILTPIACDEENGILAFAGVLQAASLDAGTLFVEWDPAAIIPSDELTRLECTVPVYDVFFAPESFDFANWTVPDLINLADMTNSSLARVRTSDLFVNLEDLERNATFTVLVTATAEDALYSANRDEFEITISSVDAVLNRNLTRFIGSFEASDQLSISLDSAMNELTFTGAIPVVLINELEEGHHMSVITSNDETFYFLTGTIVELSNMDLVLDVSEARLEDIFEQLYLDTSFDLGRTLLSTSSSSGGVQRYLLDIDAIIDRTFKREATEINGDLRIYAEVELTAYGRVEISVDFDLLGGVSASTKATVGGNYDSVVSFKHAESVTREVSFEREVWRGPPRLVTFVVLGVPVWLLFVPKVTFEASASLTLEASVEVNVTQTGQAQIFGGREDEDYFFGGSASFSQDLTTEVVAQATAAAESCVTFTISVDAYGVAGVDLNLKACVNFDAKAEALTNLRLLLTPPPFEFTQFDVTSGMTAPIVGRAFGLEEELGSPLELEYPLLTLPDYELEKVDVQRCQGENALVMRAKMKRLPYTAFIPNQILNSHYWISDFDPEGLAEDANPIAPLLQLTGELTEDMATWTLPRSALSEDLDYQIPSGTIYLRSTATIPPLPFTLIKSASVTDLFGAEEFECCDDSDCDIKYPGDEFVCTNNMCESGADRCPKTIETFDRAFVETINVGQTSGILEFTYEIPPVASFDLEFSHDGRFLFDCSDRCSFSGFGFCQRSRRTGSCRIFGTTTEIVVRFSSGSFGGGELTTPIYLKVECVPEAPTSSPTDLPTRQPTLPPTPAPTFPPFTFTFPPASAPGSASPSTSVSPSMEPTLTP